jgi:hypothetical protein
MNWHCMVTDTKKENSVFAFVRGKKTCREYIRRKIFTAPACTNKTFVMLTFLAKYAVANIYEHKFCRDHCVEQINFRCLWPRRCTFWRSCVCKQSDLPWLHEEINCFRIHLETGVYHVRALGLISSALTHVLCNEQTNLPHMPIFRAFVPEQINFPWL